MKLKQKSFFSSITRFIQGEFIKAKGIHYLIGVVLIFFSAVNFAANNNDIRHLNIKQQPLAEAIKQFSIVFNTPFVINSELGETEFLVNIQGEYSLNKALDYIFKQSQISYKILNFGVMILPRKEGTKNTAIDEIVVTGIRGALQRSRDIKRATVEISDVIAAEDMGNYPDINLAESLQRIPGVTITREAGEGRQLSLRGTLPDFTQVTLNGIPVLANNDSPMDSREQKQRDRSFDFNVFSSELFNQVQVFKAYSAEHLSGGLAGTVALQTAKPFDQPGFNLILSPQIGGNEYSDQLAKRFTGLVSNTWGDWGALLSASYGKRYAEERGANTFRWRKIIPQNISLEPLSSELQNQWLNGEIYVPRGNRYSIWRSEQSRLGLGVALEYDAENTSITLDILHAVLDSQRNEYHLYPRGQQSTPIIDDVTQIVGGEINAANELIYSAYKDARVATESRAQLTKTDYNQVVFNSNTSLNERLNMSFIAGIEDSNFDIPLSNKIYTKGQSDVSIDYRDDPFFADIQYSSDLLALSTWQMQEIDLEEYTASTNYKHAGLSFDYQHLAHLSIQAGFQFTHFNNASASLFQDDLLMDEWAAYANGIPQGESDESGIVSTMNNLPASFTQPLYQHPNVDWLTLQTNSAMQYFGVNPFDLTKNDKEITQSQHQTTEIKHSAYYLMSWVKAPLNVKVGLKFQQENVQVTHKLLTQDVMSEQKHHNWLPSINVSWEFDKNWLLRASVSRNTARPALTDLSNTLKFEEETNTVLGFNDSLAPYRSSNIDLALEGYISHNVLFSLSAFYKSISDFVATKVEVTSFGKTGLPNLWPESDLNSDTIVNLVTKDNHESASLNGVETMLRYEWSHLPSPWQNMGTIGHYTFTDGNMTYYNELTGEKLFDKPFPYLSKQTASVTFYYETDIVSARLSASYRDKYIHKISSQTLEDEDETGFHSTIYVDANLAYQLNQHWQFKLQAQNLTNEREEQYSDSANRAYNSVTSGRSYYLGLTYQY
ncbi:TonB-dependent receptor [uncultured Psychrosphaera sp.]|uniref:TonB-dependent receptor n=1 Tax=uncultured Psychrosphaera sp. TaxID=1403522 RepID=UPI002601A0BF|nr:TonB-dependent receptor [uncultured Psychrosphaera sp.]